MKEINDILARHFSGEASPEDEKVIEIWKAENEAEYKILAEAWGEEIQFKEYDNLKAWDKIESQIVEPKKKVFTLKTVLRYSAAACFAALIGLTAKWYFSPNDFIALNNETNQAQKYVLPDGSNIWLAPGSELEYAREFEEKRDLKLDGEAFFEVARDENHPFIIQTDIGEIEVLGTAFNVESTKESTIVSVEHGLVALRNEKDEVKLAEGQSAEASESSISEIIEVDPNYKSWQTGKFIFYETPLEEVVNRLSRYYDKEIIIESEKAKSEPLTAEFNNQSLEEIIEIIVLTCDVESESTDDKVILK